MKRYGESVLLLYNEPQTTAESERGVLDELAAVEAALTRLEMPFVKVGLRTLRDLPARLTVEPGRLAVNLVEGFPGHPDEPNLVPAVCRAFGRSVTGNDTAALSLALDKAQAKAVLAAAGVPVPPGITVPVGGDLKDCRLPAGRYMVKPLRTDGSEGIDADSVAVWPGPALAAAVRRVHDGFGQPALVERFFGTREFNLSLLQDGKTVRVLPLAEIVFDGFGPDRPPIVGYAAKWRPESFDYVHTRRVLPAPVDAETAARLAACATQAWEALGCRDYARVDIRLEPDGALAVIDVNPNPDIAPDAGFPRAAEAGGYTYADFVAVLLRNALERLDAKADLPRPPPAPLAGGAPPTIRTTVAADRDRILGFTQRTGFFRPDELDIAREVLDEAIQDGPGGHYQSLTLESDGAAAGWICFGPTPCAVGTWDIYWIVVAPEYQSRKLGRALLQAAESRIRERGGRLCVLETSGRPLYRATRGFYLKCGYTESALLPDYYGPHDAMVIYTKPLLPPA